MARTMVVGLARILPDLGARTLVMGVLNVTPDSFSDGGRYASPEAALDRALRMMDDGADLIDVGGESTRPGAEAVDATTERDRVVPVIERLVARGVGPISIDTTKAAVAEAALDAGAAIVNDISAMRFDPAMPGLVAARKAGVVLMHTRGRPREMQVGDLSYEGGVVEAVVAHLEEAVASAVDSGVDRTMIAIDPGIGFGKTVEQNLMLLARLERLQRLGLPILVGTSNKSFLGAVTGRETAERAFGTAATVALAIDRGASIVRVHDVAAMVDVAAVADAVARHRRRD